MANYKETEVLGSRWQRANRIMIDNPLDQTPSLVFNEEEIVNLGDSTFKQQLGVLMCNFNPASEIILINPETGEELGQTATHLQLYIILHSLYMQLVKTRDSHIVTPVVDPTPPAIDLPPPPAPIIESDPPTGSP